ncbi:MAG: hypothetical protein F6J86_26050 [Symploca sp. SIO1B1]|nr:hypothetical protein [Symploca sp. SIO1B1]
MPDERIAFKLGEIYEDLLRVAAFQSGKSMAGQASSIVSSQLMKREEQIKARNKYLAWKRGIDEKELWLNILQGDGGKITDDELAELREKGLIDMDDENVL